MDMDRTAKHLEMLFFLDDDDSDVEEYLFTHLVEVEEEAEADDDDEGADTGARKKRKRRIMLEVGAFVLVVLAVIANICVIPIVEMVFRF